MINDYICISDFGKYKEEKSKADDIIRKWLRNRITLEFLETWESIYNPNFKSVEFDSFRKSAGLHTFTLSVTEWCKKTNANGIARKRKDKIVKIEFSKNCVKAEDALTKAIANLYK